MAIVSPPESAPPPPSRDEATPISASTYAVRDTQAAPPARPQEPADVTREFETEPLAPTQRNGGVVAGLILIALGIVVLFGTWFPAGGAWLFIGLAVAFALARVLTGQAGYAVPAGILLGFGSFVWLTERALLNPAGGMFFVFLGLGFVATYAIAARPRSAWPVVPAMLLIGFGVFVQATTFGLPLGQFWWLWQYWPLSLVALGAWFLLRDRLPVELRAPVAIVGATVLILIGLLVVAAGMTTVATPYARGPMPMQWPIVQVPFGNPQIQDTVSLSAPAASMDSIRLANTSGSTVVRATSGSDMTVQATRHYWDSNQPPDVQLVPINGVLDVQAAAVPGTYIDYVIDVPAALGADVRSASGSIALTGLTGPVRIETASGGIDAHDLGGPAILATASGGIRISNIAGELRVSSVSGGVRGTGIKRLADVHSMSGGIDLSGDFATNAQVASVSGSVVLRFTPAASVHVDATTVSGDVNASGLGLLGQISGPHSLSGTLANGGPTVSVRTTSGSIQLLRSA